MTRQKWPPWPRKGLFFADFHIHSKYSRATSKEMTPAGLAEVAVKKGLSVVGTGDFTHPGYLRDLKEQLEPAPDQPGLYVLRDQPNGPRFVLTAEVSNIYTQGGRSRRIHTVLFAPDMETAEGIQARLKAIGNISSDGRPIFGFSAKDLVRLVTEENPECFIVPAHVWTPWFSLFGAKSGFDSIEECFEEQTEQIHALETGLSSDPQMNWRLSALDAYTLISNSDAHSPWKLAREANVFSCKMDYRHMMEAMAHPKKGFLGTIEFFPEEGKYHFDGHRACGVCLTPKEAMARDNICPVCGRPLTMGVAHRVEELADRPEGFVPETALPCVHLIPLEEIIAEAFGVKSITARVRREYLRVVEMAGPELEILLWMPEEELKRLLPPDVAQGIVNMRKERIDVTPGHDGVYGKIRVIGAEGGSTSAAPSSNNPGAGGRSKASSAGAGMRQKGLFAGRGQTGESASKGERGPRQLNLFDE